MKIYLAGERQSAGPDPGTIPLWLQGGKVKRRLFSYFYHQDKQNQPDQDVLTSKALSLDLFLDSGAFTAFTKQETIDRDKYAGYVLSNPGLWSVVSSLDHIGEGYEAAKLSCDNFIALESLGLTPCPVWHVREPDEWLKFYLDSGYDYILIGGMVPETTEWLQQRLDQLFGEVLTDSTGKPLAKLHGFGLTDQKLMFRYPWYSVDSSSWLAYGIYGKCVFPVDQGGTLRPVQFSKEHSDARKANGWAYHSLPGAIRDKVDGWLQEYGVTADQCAGHYSYRDAVNAAVFQDLEKYGVDTFQRTQRTFF